MTHYYEPKERPIPRPTGWIIDCPCCGEEIEYLPTSTNNTAFTLDPETGQEEQLPPAEDDRIFLLDPAEWPVCHACQLLLEPEAVEISIKATKRSPLLTQEDFA